MYKAAVRAVLRHGVRRLNAGDPEFILRMATDQTEMTFPGDNTWATMFRPLERSRRAHATHRGVAECRAFADAFIAEGIQLEVEDILVNGPPWRTKVAFRGHAFVPTEGDDAYANRVAELLELRWGKVVRWEVFEDTQRTAEWDCRRDEVAVGA